MKTISEINELMGIGRHVLQDYDDMNLVHPSNKEEIERGKAFGRQVKWLYDDEAIRKLQLISIFREIGRTRNEVKRILETPNCFGEELERAIEELEEKRKRIDSIIKYTRIVKALTEAEIPQFSLETLAMANIDKQGMGAEPRAIVKRIQDNPALFSKMLEQIEDTENYSLPLTYAISQLGNLKELSPDSLEVREYVTKVVIHFIRIASEQDGIPTEGRKQYINEVLSEFKRNPKEVEEMMDDWISQFEDDNSIEMNKELGTEDNARFIIEALTSYKTYWMGKYNK